MSSSLKIKLNLYGMFRQYIDKDYIELVVDRKCSLKELKKTVYKYIQEQCDSFNDEQLIKISAFATENEILQDDSLIVKDCCLSILPPVCGG